MKPFLEQQDKRGEISDGYHTFNELYEHRFALWIALCKALNSQKDVWRSRVNSDGSVYPGWFLLGMGYVVGSQLSYHLPERLWNACDFAMEIDRPVFDGHTSKDVVDRLYNL